MRTNVSQLNQMLMLRYLVFLDARMADNVIQARAAITMQDLQVPRTLDE